MDVRSVRACHSFILKDNVLTFSNTDARTQVRGYKNLDESLDAFFEGNKFDGLRWYENTPQEEKLETRRVPYIKKLPPHLILHLKRFEQDWSRGMLQLKKISDRLEFPFDLDLKKYSKPVCGAEGMDEEEKEEDAEKKDDSYYKYRLAGIVVHRGVFYKWSLLLVRGCVDLFFSFIYSEYLLVSLTRPITLSPH